MQTRVDIPADSTDDFFAKVGKGIFAIPLGFAFVVAALVWKGFVTKTVWNWFLPAIFGPSMPSLQVGSAVAILVVLAILNPRRSGPDNKDAPKLGKQFQEMFVTPAVQLAFAWLIHWAAGRGYIGF